MVEMHVSAQEVMPGVLLLLSAAVMIVGEKWWSLRKPQSVKTEQKTELLEELDDQEFEWPERLMSAAEFRAHVARKSKATMLEQWQAAQKDPRGEADR
jgi:hypothetical protein